MGGRNMQPKSLKSKVAKGAIWAFLEKMSTQVVTFVVGMILARLLTPDAYGTVTLTAIFFTIANVLVDGGFGNALIQKKDADELDYNSVFYLNVALSLLAYAVLFLAAPWIARFYDTPVVESIVRVSALCLVFNAVGAIQNAELTKKMLFHLSFKVSLVSCVASAVCGVALAFLGYGVWALVWSSLASALVGVIARWAIVAWRPKPMFSLRRLKPLFSYGWKMAASGLLDQLFRNLNGLLIGKFYTKADLAYVNKGRHLPALAMNEVDATIGRVSFPALVLLQDDKAKLRDAMRRMIQCSTFLVFPLMVGIAPCSRSILRLLYGPQWTPAAPYMMLACFTFALRPFQTINLRGIVAMGRSDVFLKLEIIKKAAVLLVVLTACRLGVFPWMAISAFVIGPFSLVVNAWPNRKLLDYTLGMQLRDVMPTALVCLAEAAVVVGTGMAANALKPVLGVPDAGTGLMLFLGAKLALQAALGAGTFFALAFVFRLQPLREYVRMVSHAMQGRWPGFAAALERRLGT